MLLLLAAAVVVEAVALFEVAMSIRMHRTVDVLHVDFLLQRTSLMFADHPSIRSYRSLLVIPWGNSIVISHIRMGINISCILRKTRLE